MKTEGLAGATILLNRCLRNDLLDCVGGFLSTFFRLVDYGLGSLLGFRSDGLGGVCALVDSLFGPLDGFFTDILAGLFRLIDDIAALVFCPAGRVRNGISGCIKRFLRR